MDGTKYNYEKVARLRREAGLTQEQLAEALGVTNVTISRVETGVAASFELLARIALKFGRCQTYFIYAQPQETAKNFSPVT